MPKLRLVTIPFSHYCEKARWALDRAGIGYVEEGHAPMLHYVPALRAGGKRTVPVLWTPHGTLDESTDILTFCDRGLSEGARLFPADDALASEVRRWEELFDDKLGPAVRRFVYFHLLPHPSLGKVLSNGSSGVEARLARSLAPLLGAAIRKGLQVSTDGAERSLARTRSIFGEVSERLADGRPWIAGDRFTAADLTFASLSAPLVLPDSYVARVAPRDELPAAVEPIVAELRATAAGALALRAYAEQRDVRVS